MIHVCYELTDSTGHYSKFVGTSMLSMFENTKSEITVHILHDNTLSADNRDKIASVAKRYNQQIKFYNVEELAPEDIALYKKFLSEYLLERFSIATMYRLVTHKVLAEDIEKVIHLDADTIINLDIEDFYKIDLGDKVLACVPETVSNSNIFSVISVNEKLCRDNIVNTRNYFSAGILLINLKYFRQMNEHKWLEDIEFVLQRYNRMPDQNILNYCFSEKSLHLSAKFNCWISELRNNNFYKLEENIYHYNGRTLLMDTGDIYNKIFFEYFMQTPWFNIEIFNNLSVGLNKWHDERQEFMIRVTAGLAGKERAFFTEHCNIKPVKKTFLIRDSEEIFATEADEDFENSIENISGSVIKLLEAMRKSARKKFYFLLIGGHYKNLCPILKSEGFVENEDFTDGQLFRSASSGEPLDTYSIVKAI